MAAEARRGCGYRKVGGTYLVGGGIGVPCDRLPLLIPTCDNCHKLGINCSLDQSRGWTWVNVAAFVNGPHIVPGMTKEQAFHLMMPPDCCESHECGCEINLSKVLRFPIPCQFCHEPEKMSRAGLLWIGTQFYKTPEEFVAEGVSQGFSRRIKAVPRGFVAGETFVLLAHPKAVPVTVDLYPATASVLPGTEKEIVFKPGVFYIWKPQRVEKIFVEADRDSEEVKAWEDRGHTSVFVPDNDPDHQGSVFDKQEDTEDVLFATVEK